MRDLDLHLIDREQAPTSTLFIGKNGTGKSSVLRSVALGLASEAEAAALLAEPFGSPFVSVGEEKGTIELELVDQQGESHSLIKEIEKHGENEERVKSISGDGPYQQSPLVVAFGAGRSNEGASSPRSTYTLVDSTYMLFNYEGTFIEPELTLRRLNDYVGTTKYEGVLSRIKSALGLQESDVLEFERGAESWCLDPTQKEPFRSMRGLMDTG